MRRSHTSSIKRVVRAKYPLTPMLVLSALAAAGCTLTTLQPLGETILAPQQASVSPNYASERITRVAIVPLFASGTANDVVADQLVGAINSEVQSRHSQWDIVPTYELTWLINEHGLMTGFRNLEADHNTYGTVLGIRLLSPATKEFLQQLHDIDGIDAILVGSYSLTVQNERRQTSRGEIYYEQREVISVTLSLLHTPSLSPHGPAPSNWWVATASRWGPRELVARAIAQTLASHIGRGAVRQL